MSGAFVRFHYETVKAALSRPTVPEEVVDYLQEALNGGWKISEDPYWVVQVKKALSLLTREVG